MWSSIRPTFADILVAKVTRNCNGSCMTHPKQNLMFMITITLIKVSSTPGGVFP